MPSKRTGERVRAVALDAKGRVLIVLEPSEKILLSQNAYSDHPVYVGKELSLREIEVLRLAEKEDRARELAHRLACSGRVSEALFVQKLEVKKVPCDLAKKLLFEVKELGYIDDERTISDLVAFYEEGLYGEQAIKTKLRQAGFADELVGKITFDHEEKKAKEYFESLKRKASNKPLRARKQELYGALLRHGFDSDLASKLLDEFALDEAGADRAREGLSRLLVSYIAHYRSKYKGYDLKVRCLAALERRGYEKKAILAEMEKHDETNC